MSDYVPPADGIEGRCTEAWCSNQVIESFRIAFEVFLDRAETAEIFVDLLDCGNWIHTPPRIKHKPGDRPSSYNDKPLLREVLRFWQDVGGIANADQITRWLDRSREEISELKREGKPEAAEARRAKYLGDLCQAYQIQVQMTRRSGHEIHYRHSHRVQSSGRLYEPGLQACSNLMKDFAFSLSDREIYNYDLKDSQLRILLRVIDIVNSLSPGETSKIDKSVLQEYLERDRSEHMQAAGLNPDFRKDVKLYKRVVTSLQFGAPLPGRFSVDVPSIQDLRKGRTSAITSAILLHSNRRTWRAIEIWKDLKPIVEPLARTVFKPLRAALRKELPRYRNEEFDVLLQVKSGRGGKVVRNACGCTMRISNNSLSAAEGRRVLAFLTQGAEAALIHGITLHCAELDGVSPLSNQHDGLVTDGEIPEDVIAEEAQRLGLEEVVLRHKGF
ncbi:MAG: hypothetical protein RLY93_04175 [Sumerlaeia bacterium]